LIENAPDVFGELIERERLGNQGDVGDEPALKTALRACAAERASAWPQLLRSPYRAACLLT